MREARIDRKTLETDIHLTLCLDGTGTVNLATGIGFLDHMLRTMAFHGGIDLELSCLGDLEVDNHHSVEDIGLSLGAAFKEALGDRQGIKRFGSTLTPMDEALALVAVDISNRPFLVENLVFSREKLGAMETQDFKEFFRAFAFSAGITLHINLMAGENDHHKIEAVFKGLGRSLREATALGDKGVASTKGVL
ncbi:MAG: imidazoleglycerol-phosphate dehydratase [delta proteobacterium ML8_F1]|nr:MAG: imidazoleglycerol-phosphate dehydratase [delta proteobacterium ML8_F1]